MKKLFSLRKLTEGTVYALNNYLLVIVCAILLSAQSIMLVHGEDSKAFDRWLPMMLAESLGISLFFALQTFIKLRNFNGLKAGITLLIGISLLVVAGLHLDHITKIGNEEIIGLEMFTLGIMAHLLVAFLPFIGKQQLNGFWQYNKSLFIRALTTALYTGVLFAGLSGAILAITELFNVDFTEKIYAYLWFIMAFPVSALIFTSGVPDASQIDALEQSDDLPNGLRLFVQFVLLPLVVIYLLILYAYMGKIMVEWSLPQGWVTILIMVFSVLGMLAMLLVHPFQQLAEHAWIKVITKNYYRSLLPPLVLQYVAIFTRINDYGFTSPRWAVVAITIWLTYICIYKVFFKGKNIILIPFTLCIVTVLFLIGPLSHRSISVWSQTAKINRLVKELGLRDNKGKLKKYESNASTDSLMNELYEATRYLSRNHETTGLEPEIHYPTADEVRKAMQADAYNDVKLYGDSTDPKWNEPAPVEFNRYDYRSAIRRLINEQYETYGILEYDNNLNELDNLQDIILEAEHPQVYIPNGPWTKVYNFENLGYLDTKDLDNISDYLDLIKIRLTNSKLGIVLLINGTEFPVEMSPVFKKYSNNLKNGYSYIKVPNKTLTIPLNKGNIHGVLVLDKIQFGEIEKNSSNKLNGELRELSGRIYLQ